MNIADRTSTELIAIFSLRVQRDKWILERQEGVDHMTLCPPAGHPWRSIASQWRLIVINEHQIYIPAFAFWDDEKFKDVSLYEIAKLNLDQCQTSYAFVGGGLDGMTCSVGNPEKQIQYEGDKYRQVKAGSVTFYSEISYTDTQACFHFYMQTDNGVGHAKFSRN